jgi:cell division protein FtsB
MNKRKIIIGLELFVGVLFVACLFLNAELKNEIELLKNQVRHSRAQTESLKAQNEELKTKINFNQLPIDSCFLQKVEACISCAGDKK